MIYIDRDAVPKPRFWEREEFQEFLVKWTHFHDVEGGSRATQKRIPVSLERSFDQFRRRALPALLDGFHGKCAYSEERIDGKTGTVILHRPPADAMGAGSDVSPEHYWWLVRQWSNWYPASRTVASAKHTQFPVVGPRSSLPMVDESITERTDPPLDHGLLLDPCLHRPNWYLEFREDGMVRAREHPSPWARNRLKGRSPGASTISALRLNSEHLQTDRKMAIVSSKSIPLESSGPEDEFAGARRQMHSREMLRFISDGRANGLHTIRLISDMIPIFEELAAEVAHQGVPWSLSPVSMDTWQPLRPIFAREWPELDDEGFRRLLNGESIEMEGLGEAGALSYPEAEPEPVVVDRSARIESIEIKNFKAIQEAVVEIPSDPVTLPEVFDPQGTGQPEITSAARWVTFLGENGSGKSSLLQALGLALAGDQLDEVMTQVDLDWSKLLRSGSDRGRIVVRFTGGSTLDLRFTANTHWWIGPDGSKPPCLPRIETYVRGYGATRLLEGGPVDHAASVQHVRLANLFDPRAQVLNAEKWLLGLEEGDFNVAAITLQGFLDPGGEIEPPPHLDSTKPWFMTRRPESDGLRVAGEPLYYLSDGYRAVITLVCDILAGLGAGLSDVRNATGIVLIDELGAHLHPRWRMEVTTRLRRELPQVQFFVSTHEPLCLRGMFHREVVRVRKHRPPGTDDDPFPPGEVSLEVVERSPSNYRVDQLLTSEFFGLDTTIDPDLDRLFQAYYRLLAVPEEDRTAEQEERRKKLRDTLDARSDPVLGFTRRDQLVYEAIDQFLAEEYKQGAESELTPEQRQARRDATLEKVKDIWRGRRALGQRRGAGGNGP